MKLGDVEKIAGLAYLLFRSEDWMQANASRVGGEELDAVILAIEPMSELLMESKVDAVVALGEKVRTYLEILKVEQTSREVARSESDRG